MFETRIGVDLEEARFWLEKGELVGIPTETVYGLAANGLNPIAVSKIYTVKQRPQFNPLILHVSNVNKIAPLVSEWPSKSHLLYTHFSPGPITCLLPKSDDVPDIITAGSDRVAIRIPAHPLTNALLETIEFPLAAPSANPSGYVSPVSADHVFEGLAGKIPYILDGGICQVGLESTIIGFENDRVIVHRLGSITADQLKTICGQEIQFELSHSSPKAPGQLKSHYATKTPLVVGDIRSLCQEYEGNRLGVLSFQEDYSKMATINLVLSPMGSLSEAAAGLFSAMRRLDAAGLDIIITEKFPDTGVGMAMNDRISRAAYPRQSE